MSDSAFEIFEDVSNPLDSVEDLLTGNDWIFNRPNPDELSVHVTGKLGCYRMTFLWQEEYSAMQFFCEYDLRLPKDRQDMTGRALRVINERLWLGHFDVAEATGAPCFRHTSLFRGWTNSSGAEHVEDLVDIALAECERHHNIFAMLAGPRLISEEILGLMMADEAGEA